MLKKWLCLTFSLMFSFSLMIAESISKKSDDGVMSLGEIDKLIKATEYNKALEELYKYIEANPENFDNAQLRITRIMNAKKQYMELADELYRIIREQPDDFEEISKKNAELVKLDREQTKKLFGSFQNLLLAAELSRWNKELERIQSDTETLINSGDYVAAVSKAKEGFVIYRDDFYEQWTQDEVVRPVNKALSDIDASLAQFNEIQKRLNDCVNDFVRAVNNERQDDIQKSYKTVAAVFSDFAKIRNKVYKSGETFITTFDYMKTISDTELTDVSFLPFARRFTLGLSNNPNTGIAGAIDSEWNSLCEKMKDAVWSKLDKYVSQFETSIPEQMFVSEKIALRSDLLPNVKQYSNLSVLVNSLYKNLNPSINDYVNHYYDVASVYAYDLLENVNSLFTGKENFMEKIAAISESKTPDEPPQVELENSDYIVKILDGISELKQIVAIDFEEMPWAKEYLEIDISKKRESIETSYRNFIDEMRGQVAGAAKIGYEIICNYVQDCDGKYVEITRLDYETAEKNYNGIEGVILEKYPDKALEQSMNLQNQISAQVAVIDRHLEIIEGCGPGDFVQTAQEMLRLDRRTLLEFRNKSVQLANLARSQVQFAEKARNEAELRFGQAESALLAENFDTARRRLQESRSKYNESLECLFSAELQAVSDSMLQSLGERINQLENQIVVRDVRKLKTRAKNEYYASNFEEAEILLNQAKTRWAVTNVEEDAEISSLLAIVNTALSMKVGRVLLPSAPLYPEMSQILSIAALYYTEGSALISNNKRSDGEAVLQEALQKLQELQLVYPLNQEASLLTLRIQKVLAPEEFDQMFDRKVAEAKVNYKVKDLQQQAYTDLLDLYEINPNYPGLKNLIYNVELEIGIRQKPVDNSSIIKSAALAKEAQKIVDSAGRDEAKLRQALAKLDEAISLNGNNNDAIRLKDQIQTSIGGKAAVVLSSEDEIKYQQAIQELQKNNLITANALVEQLLQKQTNRNSSKILELQRKIKALL